MSVFSNIAQGFERGTTNELLAFLYIARGSAGEVRSMLCFLERRQVFANFKSQVSHLKSTAESCSRQLRAWAEHLQNSQITGQRHLSERSGKEYQTRKYAADFRQQLVDKLPAGYPLRRKK